MVDAGSHVANPPLQYCGQPSMIKVDLLRSFTYKHNTTNKHTNKQTNKQASNKQTNKHQTTNERTNEQNNEQANK